MAAPFPNEVIDKAFENANGQCQCQRSRCKHPHSFFFSRCTNKISKGSRGKESPQSWEAHHKNANGPGTFSNCEILCTECHKQTQSYGRR